MHRQAPVHTGEPQDADGLTLLLSNQPRGGAVTDVLGEPREMVRGFRSPIPAILQSAMTKLHWVICKVTAVRLCVAQERS